MLDPRAMGERRRFSHVEKLVAVQKLKAWISLERLVHFNRDLCRCFGRFSAHQHGHDATSPTDLDYARPFRPSPPHSLKYWLACSR